MSAPVPANACPHCGVAARPGARFCRACGNPLTAEAPVVIPAPTRSPVGVPAPTTPATLGALVPEPPDSRQQRRRQWKRLLIGGGLVVVLLIGWTVATAIDRAAYPPARSVRAFFAALAAKDTAAIRSLASCRYGPLCGPNALAAGYTPPTDVKIVQVRYGARSSTVAVQYRIDGKSFNDVIAVHRTGWYHDWSITAAPGQPLVVDSAHLPTVRVAGATVMVRPDSPGKAWALPGAYTIAVVDDPLYIAAPITLTVGGSGEEARVNPTVKLRDTLAAEVDRQVKARIDACAQQTTIRPDTDPAPLSGNDCPFEAEGRYTITRDITWKVTRCPELALSIGDTREVTVSTTSDGEAVIGYEWTTDILEPRRWTSFTEPIPIVVGGHVTTGDDGKVVWTP
ncbi:zinc ribbon domain-containing protein [Dactylosporangium sp. NPDC005572]|uniref:zinc ribbon domain-containing protein n=1 Tax=Dactylosporangium sp. NPDC005572 TaxID=3156889 RepID=UPI0033B2BE7E